MLESAHAYTEKCWKNQQIPFVEELCLELGINDDTIVEWAKEHEEFSATIKRLKTLQKLHLKRDALEKRTHANMAIFLLKANHGLDEKKPDIPPEDRTITIHWVDTPRTEDQVLSECEQERKV
jgi:hypothetical protein